jgi:hypothetical protein
MTTAVADEPGPEQTNLVTGETTWEICCRSSIRAVQQCVAPFFEGPISMCCRRSVLRGDFGGGCVGELLLAFFFLYYYPH